MDTEITGSIPPSTPCPDELLDMSAAPAAPPAVDPLPEFPFLPPSAMPCSVEEIGLSVVLDPPALRDERSGSAQESSAQASGMGGEDHDAPGHAGSWPLLVLVSYSSAVTLALAWMVWTGRHRPIDRGEHARHGAAAPEIPAASIRPEAATGKGSPPPLPPQNLTSLGKPIRLGSIEVTPLAVERGPIELLRSFEPGESQWTKTASLLLRVRLTNVSSDATFSPLEIPSVRECPGVRTETFLESERGWLGMYPLALESEWAVAGQRFPLLRPGESAETVLASAPIHDGTLGDTLTWRARLRVAPHQTDVFGVTFSPSEIIDR